MSYKQIKFLAHHAQFYEAVDVLISTIDWRLDEQSLQPASTLEQLLTNASYRSVDSAAQMTC